MRQCVTPPRMRGGEILQAFSTSLWVACGYLGGHAATGAFGGGSRLPHVMASRYSSGDVSAARLISAFPWGALERLDRRTEAAARRGRRLLERAGVAAELAASLQKLIGAEVEIHFRALTSRAPALLRLSFIVAGQSAPFSIGMEPPLANALLGKLLRRSVTIVDPTLPPEPAVLGALSALIVEAARDARAKEPLVPLGLATSAADAAAAVILATVIIEGRPYAAALWLPESLAAPAEPPARASLAALASTEVALPLVVAQCLASPALLAELEPGAAFCPGVGWSIDAEGIGSGLLVAANSEHGVAVELGPEGKIVVRHAESVPVTTDINASSASDLPAEGPTLADAVLDAPIVVRVEVGQLSMAAREWAALRCGDVIGTGRRIAEPVLLRAGGQVIARGELVNLEGELAVRILELAPGERGADGSR